MMSRLAVPWYNYDIKIAKRVRRKAERKWRRTKLECDFIDFKKKKNHGTYLMNQARREFYTNFIKGNNDDQSRLFKAAKKLLGKNDELAFPDYSDNVALVNDTGKYFVGNSLRY